MSVNEEGPAEKPTEKPAGDQWKKWLVGLVCLAAVAISAWTIIRQLPPPEAPVDPSKYGFSRAAPKGGPAGGGAPGGQQAPGTRGQITKVSADAITLQGRDGVPKTFALTAATKITLGQKPATKTDLKEGQRARIVSKDDKSADEVNIRTGPPRGPGGGPGGPPGQPSPDHH